MSAETVDAALLDQAGLPLPPETRLEVLEAAAGLRRLIARLAAPLPLSAEPAIGFRPLDPP